MLRRVSRRAPPAISVLPAAANHRFYPNPHERRLLGTDRLKPDGNLTLAHEETRILAIERFNLDQPLDRLHPIPTRYKNPERITVRGRQQVTIHSQRPQGVTVQRPYPRGGCVQEERRHSKIPRSHGRPRPAESVSLPVVSPHAGTVLREVHRSKRQC
jgi:hypothetical protein